MNGQLRGRGVLITGASQGLGRVIATACVQEGAHVVLCARGGKLLEQTRSDLAAKAPKGQHVLARAMDVSAPNKVKELVNWCVRSLPTLDGLVNNAGAIGPIGRTEDTPWNDWAKTMEINLFGTVLLCREVLPVLRKRGHGKIVNLSGGGAANPRPRFSAYAASKAAVVRFSETLAAETQGSGIDVNTLAPGALNTKMLDEILAAGPERIEQKEYAKFLRQKKEGGTPLERAAALCVFLLSSASDGITGRMISAVWDEWEKLPARRSQIAETDVYTLRRIIPKDRGLNWS